MKQLFIWLCTLFLLTSASVMAGKWDDCTLYEAWLRNDLSVWNQYLHANNFSRLSEKEQIRYISYEYGYVATAIDEKAPDAKEHLEAFESHIRELALVLPEERMLCYKSAAAAYHALYNKVSFLNKGYESYNYVKKAYQVDSLSPLVLTLKGNVDLYAPKTFGGSKSRAMQEFLLAKKLYEKRDETHCNWNYTSCCLCIAQAYEKSGKLDKAIETCRDMLKKEPDYAYVRDTYLPSLEQKRAKKQ